MKFITLFIFLMSVLFVFSEEVYEVDGNKYLFSPPIKSDWYEANQYCRYRGMFLIDVPTYKEQERLVKLIHQLDSPYNGSAYWTSGNDLTREGYFVWMSSGDPFVFTYWATNQPDNYQHSNESENCVQIIHTIKYYWNDSVCRNKNYFICRSDVINTSKILLKQRP